MIQVFRTPVPELITVSIPSPPLKVTGGKMKSPRISSSFPAVPSIVIVLTSASVCVSVTVDMSALIFSISRLPPSISRAICANPAIETIGSADSNIRGSSISTSIFAARGPLRGFDRMARGETALRKLDFFLPAGSFALPESCSPKIKSFMQKYPICAKLQPRLRLTVEGSIIKKAHSAKNMPNYTDKNRGSRCGSNKVAGRPHP